MPYERQRPPDLPKIILLNGVGSVGKSSLAKALQDLCSRPYLHVQMDSFLDMLPARYQDHSDAFSYSKIVVGGFNEVEISGGPLGDQVLSGMRKAVAALAAQGLNLIVDDVLMGSDDPGNAEYRDLLDPYAFYRVGVFASLDTLEQRERQRGDRLLGLARWQFGRVHKGMAYDLDVHADTNSPLALAEQIKLKFGL